MSKMDNKKKSEKIYIAGAFAVVAIIFVIIPLFTDAFIFDIGACHQCGEPTVNLVGIKLIMASMARPRYHIDSCFLSTLNKPLRLWEASLVIAL